MHNLVITTDAKNDIDLILENVSEYTGFFSSADKLLEEFLHKFELIRSFPHGAGRMFDEERREAFCRGYRIVYKVIHQDVYIITVIHSSRLYPRP